MPGFGSPFSGLANDRKLTDEELVRAIRFMVAASFAQGGRRYIIYTHVLNKGARGVRSPLDVM